MTAEAAVAASGEFWTGELVYALPERLIAQAPAARREDSRLMVVDRAQGSIEHATFAEIGRFLPRGALLVANDSRVIPARLHARKEGSGGSVELLVLAAGEDSASPAMVRSSKPLRRGQVLDFGGGISARVVDDAASGRVTIDFAPLAARDAIRRRGEIPLPPYIERSGGPRAEDRERYQTVYAEHDGSVAAPTAGLHFTDALLADLSASGIEMAKVTLHVGPGTFTPVRGDLSSHEMEEERYEIGAETAARIASARAADRRVVAVGTTTVRALESASDEDGRVAPGAGATKLFIRPGHRFRVVESLITNFHLPGSTLLALVMALAGRDRIRGAYRTAVAEGYRFYSYGDAMLIL